MIAIINNVCLLFSSDDVDRQIEQENIAQTAYIAQEASAIKEAMQDMRELLGDQGEQLRQVDESMEDNVVILEDAHEELKEAAKHQQVIRPTFRVGVVEYLHQQEFSKSNGWVD